MLTFPTSNSQLLLWWACIFASGLLAASIISRLAALMTAWFTKRRLLHQHTIVAEYTAPEGLQPYELGYLYDNRFGDNELFAAVLSMAQKKVVRLVGKTPASYAVTAIKVSNERKKQLSDAEMAIYVALENAGGGIAWKALSSESSEVAGVQDYFEDAVVCQLQDKGYLHTGSMLSTLRERSTLVRWASLLLAAGLFYVPLTVVHTSSQATGLESGFMALDQNVSTVFVLLLSALAWPCIYAYCQLVAYVYFRAAGLPFDSTPQLRALWPQIVGYRVYIKTIEWPRLQSSMELQDDLLPYCVAYGLSPQSIS